MTVGDYADEIQVATEDDLLWIADFGGKLQDLEKRLGRSLTPTEIDAIGTRCEFEDTPNVERAYRSYYSGRKEPDLSVEHERIRYLTELGEDPPEPEEQVEEAEEITPLEGHVGPRLQDLDAKLGRTLTAREVEAIYNKVDAGEADDAEEALKAHYAESGRELPDLTNTASRCAYASEIVDDLAQIDAEERQAEEGWEEPDAA